LNVDRDSRCRNETAGDDRPDAAAHGSIGVRFDRVHLKLGEHHLLRGVRWEVRPGQRWVLAGGNGVGKTQLCKLMAGERWPTPMGSLARRRIGDGLAWVNEAGTEVEAVEVLHRVLHVSGEQQDRYARRDWNLRLREVIGTGFDRTDIPLRKLTRGESALVSRAVGLFGLKRLERRRFLELSYGERRRVLLARAWVARPALLLLDEPFNGLDTTHRRAVQAALRVLLKERCTVVLTTHRDEELPAGFTHRARVERGRVVVEGGESADAGHPHARDVRRRAPLAAGLAGKPAPAMPGPAKLAPTLVELRNVDLYREWRPVLRGLDWTIRRGEHWVVRGATGSGKSTLLQLLHGTRWPAYGGVVRRARFPAGTPIEAWKRRVGYVSPELQTLAVDDALGAGNLLDLVIGGWRGSLGLDWKPGAGEKRRALAALAVFGLDDLAGRYPREVSYGQLRLALLARALVRNPPLLLLDEPFTGLDREARARMLVELERRAAAGATLVLAVHHAGDVPNVVEHQLLLRGGKAYFSPFR
jgi:molybdate transport system ATP-binding protein